MRVKIHNGETLEQTGEDWLVNVMGDDDDARLDAYEELQKAGRAWVGGGAAPLMLLTLVRGT
jgi:hypothetical protein